MSSPTPDFPDWAQPIGTFERAAQLGSGNVQDSGLLLVLGTSEVQSVFLDITLPTAAAGTRFVMEAQFGDAGGQVTKHTISFHSAGTYADGTTRLMWELPVTGSSIYVSLYSPSAAVCPVTVYGSSRVCPQVRVRSMDGNSNGLLANVPAASVAAGATSATTYLPPVTRDMSVNFVSGSATSLLTILAVARDTGAVTARGFGRVQGTGNNVLVNPVQIPLLATEMSWTNTGAAAVSLGAVFWDVS